MLASPEGDRLWSYWKEKLSDELPALELPADRPRPPIQTFAGDCQRFRLSREAVDGLIRLSRMSGTTLFIPLAAVFEAFLHRYSGQDDILLGALTSGRSRARFSEVAGYFVNPIVLRGDFSDGPTFNALLSRTRAVALGAFERQDYPFSMLAQKLQQAHNASRPPLIQAMMIYQQAQAPDQEALARFAVGEVGAKLKLGEIEVESLDLNLRTTQFDLALKLAATRDGLSGSLEYSTDLFDATTAARMVDHLQSLIEASLLHPSLPISDLPLMREAERNQLLVVWNQTHLDFPEGECVHTLIERQVRLTPDSVALSFLEEQVTYGQLNLRASQVAHELRRLGAGPEARIGICMERSVEMVIGIFGILKSGGAYVPLDPKFPYHRLSLMISDSGLCATITRRRTAETLPPGAGRILCLDPEWCLDSDSSLDPDRGRLWQGNASNHWALARPENLAYVIYTSGSTGRPKGVMVNHRNVVNFFHAMDRELDASPPGVWLAVTSISFDISVLELLWTLARGFRVVIQEDAVRPAVSREAPSRGIERQLESLMRQANAGGEPAREESSVPALVTRHGVTHLQCTPSLARLMADEPESLIAMPILKRLLIGGEALPLQLAGELAKLAPTQIHNMYGPTETTVWSMTDPVATPVERITIGRPLGNTEVYITGRALEPTPINVPGALYIGGEGVVRGYVNSPDLTAERFVPDPFGQRAGTRLYDTGDLARYLRGGQVEFLGRTDQQLKLRGYRVEVGEVEVALEGAPDVLQAAVALKEDARGNKRLVAYAVIRSGASLTTSEMRDFLKTRLPEYMIPSVLFRLDAMPLTPNGKIDRRGLPAPDLTGTNGAGRKLAPPRTAAEEVLASVWAEVLGLDEVGVEENFFDLGGHSILASHLISRLREIFRIELPMRTFFESPTVAAMAASMAGEQGGKVERIAELLISVASYSDEEVESRLQGGRLVSEGP
jgi:non-ribosomal peptide synthetase component F/acyl carrier protein